MEFLLILLASRLGRDAGSAAPAERTEASPPCRLTIRGTPRLLVRAGAIHEHPFDLPSHDRSRSPRPALLVRRERASFTASSRADVEWGLAPYREAARRRC